MSNQNAAITSSNKRDEYLFQTLGLDHDPFAFASTELELQVNRDDPPFLTYFVDMPVADSDLSLLENLKQPGHAVVYGAAGSGKTMLRYALEAQCRGMADRILIVSQPMGKGGPKTALLLHRCPHLLKHSPLIYLFRQSNSLIVFPILLTLN